MNELRLIASAPRGFGDLLARELVELGATEVRERTVGVDLKGTLETAYRICLESRLASRLFLVVADYEAADEAQFYHGARAVPWTEHVDAHGTLACDFSGRHPTITHSGFGALRLKDAICDSLREATGARPNVTVERPSVRVHAHANGRKIVISIDLAGEGLHRRGYRTEAGEAPLRENLAAGLLVRAGWPAQCEQGVEFLDPMCGAGTLVIEAALIAARRAPGLPRDYFGFLGWLGHQPELWQRVRAAAIARERPLPGRMRGLDPDQRVLQIARTNAARAGFQHALQFDAVPLAGARPMTPQPGFLAVNPPYGVRLEDRERAAQLMRELGSTLRDHFNGWQAAVLAGSADLGLELGIRAERVHTVWNGALECRLLRVHVTPEQSRALIHKSQTARIEPAFAESAGARMFANRLAKNIKLLAPWVKREAVSCYRLYDADMPEYSFAIDRYAEAGSERVWLYVQEYAAPATIEAEAVVRRRNEALAALPGATGVPAERIHLRMRRKTARGDQYQKLAEARQFVLVEEAGLQFHVNFTDYLDTGLFLDHRLTRARLRTAAVRKRFLNLFAYTGTATVYAAAGRARSTTTIDMSATYLDWAQRNLTVNGLSGREHEFIQDDCIGWLKGAVAARARYDLIFLDPPTFSNSKRMQDVLDVERDHVDLIHRCMALLAPTGLLVFSCNAQRFKLDPTLGERYAVTDITRVTIPRDFVRNPRIHVCFEIRHRV
ncbi:MAG TPA: bifunctional 23S rRNA (guanine(2069)-N(7))-methyltransferase RlmK/23S rRNA (guanine(2445)-N(2))-methyltransferase RlmL [Steroidobacteraceae bacterium]|nr:bifunctional 23S rRNA (guanine(2069)-N(7))-methyltransferase RlmK/23S rRNA (guanine(2445)-N(2))-methyltransferase RlmL [Steroidobacteraceae bacterium]